MSATGVTRHIRAPRARVYRALRDPESVQRWMVPDGMTSRVHVVRGARGQHVPHRVGLHENLPPGLAPADNELGWDMALAKLARLVEREQ